MLLVAVLLVLLFPLTRASAITNAIGFGFQSSGEVLNDDFYKLTAKPLVVTPETGSEISFEQFRGKVVLITNVASACGYTASNYEELVRLQEKYGNDLAIILLPSNEFGRQEPGSAKEIEQYVRMQGEAAKKFILLEKSAVNPATTTAQQQQSKLMEWLKHTTKSESRPIKWNFETKFIISRDGKRVARYSEAYSPAKLKPTLKYYLNQQQ